MRLLVFWDSITEGFWDLKKWGWVNRLRIYYWKKEINIEVVNCWIAWDTTNDILRRFSQTKDFQIAKYQEEATIIFAIGINDSYNENEKQKVPLDIFEKNLKDIINECRKDPLIKRILFLSCTNVDETRSAPTSWREIYYTNKTIKEYNKAVKSCCEQNNIWYIDVFWILEKEDICDGVHPNATGHKKIYKQVKECLKPIFLKP